MHSLGTYCPPPHGVTIVVPFASVIFVPLLNGGHIPWDNATAESYMTFPSSPASASKSIAPPERSPGSEFELERYELAEVLK